MSEQSPALPGQAGPLRTLAVRLSDERRAQLDLIAQLNDRTVTEEIRLALEAWVERSRSDPAVLARAESVKADIEREAQVRRDAIAAIFATALPTRSRAGKRSDQPSTE